eukprot:15366311-Ditylum_brightwellii.AAC.3
MQGLYIHTSQEKWDKFRTIVVAWIFILDNNEDPRGTSNLGIMVYGQRAAGYLPHLSAHTNSTRLM